MEKFNFYYTVKARLAIFNKISSELEFPEFEKRFENTNPILAREAAFNYYESFIHGLLLGQGLSENEIENISHQEITKILNPYIDPKTSSWHFIGEKKIELPDFIGNGIRVSLQLDGGNEADSISEAQSVSLIQENELIIHWINEDNPGKPFPAPIHFLEEEYAFYIDNNYDTKGSETTIKYLDFDEYNEGYLETALGTHTILKTPFDWTGYDKPYWWGDYKDLWDEPDNEKLEEEIQILKETSLKELIKNGEGQQIEFKPTLLYHFGTKGYNFSIRNIIAKVICSFLNSRGGKLFIGLADDGTVQGLSHDFSLARPVGKDPRDYFKLEVDRIIREYFKDAATYISGEFETIDDVEIFVFTVFPNTKYPTFIKGQNGKEFFVRLTTSCEPYTDIENIVRYCMTHWGLVI